MKIIESQRLLLRNVKRDDIDDLYALLFSDPQVVQHTFGKEISDKQQAQNFIIENGNFSGVFGLSALVERDSGAVIGLAGVVACQYLNVQDYEFGFILGKEYWGKGYAKEIGRAQIEYIKEHTHAKRVLALVSASNEGSVKTINSLGLSYLTTVDTQDRGAREVYVLNF